jgi:hypothetical protein
MQSVPVDVVLHHIVLPFLNGLDVDSLQRSGAVIWTRKQEDKVFRALLRRDFGSSLFGRAGMTLRGLYLQLRRESFSKLPHLSDLVFRLDGVNWDTPPAPGTKRPKIESPDSIFWSHLTNCPVVIRSDMVCFLRSSICCSQSDYRFRRAGPVGKMDCNLSATPLLVVWAGILEA